jgi:putative transcriptional regulator
MKKDMFEELMESVREGGRILRGEARASRTFEVREPDVAAVREGYGLSQQEFAAMMGISTRTLQNWEQGRRKPHGAARVLLRVAAEHPDVVWDTIKRAS